MINLHQHIKNAFNKISFEPGELSYLAATSKVELPIRDRLSWRLQQELPELDVLREWKRSDIAILNGENPVSIIELKATYSHKAISGECSKYVDRLWKDEEKAQELINEDYQELSVPIYTILLVGHARLKNPENVSTKIKYGHLLKKALQKKTCEEIGNIARKDFENHLYKPSRREIIYNPSDLKLNCEMCAFGVSYEIYSWVCLFTPEK